MERLAAAELRNGRGVILDGIFRSEGSRKKVERIAKEYGSKFIVIHVRVPLEVAEERLEKRLEDTTHHAGPKTLEKIRQEYEAPETPDFEIDGTDDMDEEARRVAKKIS